LFIRTLEKHPRFSLHCYTNPGFETRHGVLNMLLTSKMLAGALTGSFLSTLFGAPATVIVAAGAAIAIELGRTTLEVGKQRFAFRKLMTENPVSYISLAKAELEHKGLSQRMFKILR
jgi:hypothetical protein